MDTTLLGIATTTPTEGQGGSAVMMAEINGEEGVW